MTAAPLHLLVATGYTQRPTYTRDSGGSAIEMYATNLTGVRCRVQPVSGSEDVRYGRFNERITHDVFVEGGQDIQGKDLLIVNGLTLDIQFVQNYDQLGVLMKLECIETKP